MRIVNIVYSNVANKCAVFNNHQTTPQDVHVDFFCFQYVPKWLCHMMNTPFELKCHRSMRINSTPHKVQVCMTSCCYRCSRSINHHPYHHHHRFTSVFHASMGWTGSSQSDFHLIFMCLCYIETL